MDVIISLLISNQIFSNCKVGFPFSKEYNILASAYNCKLISRSCISKHSGFWHFRFLSVIAVNQEMMGDPLKRKDKMRFWCCPSFRQTLPTSISVSVFTTIFSVFLVLRIVCICITSIQGSRFNIAIKFKNEVKL